MVVGIITDGYNSQQRKKLLYHFKFLCVMISSYTKEGGQINKKICVKGGTRENIKTLPQPILWRKF